MEKSSAFVRLHGILSLLRIFLLINETDRGSGFLLGDDASLNRCPVTVLRTQFLKVYREKCFEFVIDHETYWDNADKDCRLRGGHLATIGDKETQAFIMETLRSIGFNKHGLWIGLNDREHEQRWVWATGENLGSYRNWGAQQGNGITHLTDDCVHLRYNDGGLWHDSPCHLGTYHYTYICQYRMIPTTTSRTSVRTSPSTTAIKSTAAIVISSTARPATASKTTSNSSPTSQTMKRTATATATSTLSSTTSPTTTTTTTTLSTRISPTTVSKSTANPISTTTAATKATTSIASSSTITTLITSSTTIPTETTKSTTIDQTLTQATTETVDAKTISSTSTSQPATITTTLPMTSATLSATTFLTVTTPDPPITSTPTSTTDERKTPEPFKKDIEYLSPYLRRRGTWRLATSYASFFSIAGEQSCSKAISPCQPLICGLDCGIFGFVYANDGCPICACAS